jgi:pimeloyl-ACP methyl ester carboxylesterase
VKPIVYLHGFGSGPESTKARFFRDQFAARGVNIEIPQLDEGDFELLTVTRQLRVIDRSVNGRSAILMGSSLGGYLTALYASTHPNIERVVLLAPAFQFPKRWRQRFSGEELAAWKASGSKLFYHYGYKAERPLGYQFVEDSVQYPEAPDFQQPALILHGTADTVVPVEVSREFAARHPNATLRELDSGHELTDVLDRLWSETTVFLGFQNR